MGRHKLILTAEQKEAKRQLRNAYARAYIARNRDKLREANRLRYQQSRIAEPEVLPGQYMHARCGTILDSAVKAYYHLRFDDCEDLITGIFTDPAQKRDRSDVK